MIGRHAAILASISNRNLFFLHLMLVDASLRVSNSNYVLNPVAKMHFQREILLVRDLVVPTLFQEQLSRFFGTLCRLKPFQLWSIFEAKSAS